jgi:hypothetical protein
MGAKNGHVPAHRAQSQPVDGNQFTIGVLIEDRWQTKVDALIRLAEIRRESLRVT